MAVNELAGKRLLVIRSSRDQDEFLNMSKAAGIDVKHVPIIDIKPISNDARVRQKIESLNEFDYAIFVSVHAGKIALELLDESWPKPPEALRVFTIGRQTAALLRPYISSVRYPESNADTEGLLELPEFQNPKNKNVVLNVHPFIASYLTKGISSIRFRWYLKHKKWITIIPRDAYNYLQYKFKIVRK